LRQQLQQRDGELTQLRSEVVSIKTSLATAQANQRARRSCWPNNVRCTTARCCEAKEAQAKALADLRDAFKALSADALKQTAPEFLALAEQSFGKFQGDGQGRSWTAAGSHQGFGRAAQAAVGHVSKATPAESNAQADTLGKVKEQLETLAQSSQSLAAETAQFRSVLKSNQARGRWGEETLRRVVEAAGMSAHCDFTEQAQSDDKKPDMIVKLPGDRFIIVDAKVPELDFLSALEVADPPSAPNPLPHTRAS
jgi:DNA recombination protein RmuC